MCAAWGDWAGEEGAGRLWAGPWAEGGKWKDVGEGSMRLGIGACEGDGDGALEVPESDPVRCGERLG